ncbi:MAG: hypothetical protein H0V34_03880 [Gammaproteobacteria bacterium]|nr:hypothetical protein [Gammaproteobacteria bacterium]
MSSVPFDTHAAVKRLTEAGVTEALIRAITEANARADVVTKADLPDALATLRQNLIRWIVGLILPLYALLIVSLFT